MDKTNGTRKEKLMQAGALAAVLLLCAGCSQEEMHKMNPLAMAAGTVTSAVGGNQSGGFTSLFSNDKIVHTEWMDIREDVMTGRSGVKGVIPVSSGRLGKFCDIKLGDSREETEKNMLAGGLIDVKKKEQFKPGSKSNPWEESIEWRRYGGVGEARIWFNICYRNGKVLEKVSAYGLGDQVIAGDIVRYYRMWQNFNGVQIGDDYKEVVKSFLIDGVPVLTGFRKTKTGEIEFYSTLAWVSKETSPPYNVCVFEINFNEKGKVVGKRKWDP